MSVRQLRSRFPDKPKSKLYLMLPASAGWWPGGRVCWNQGLSRRVREVQFWLSTVLTTQSSTTRINGLESRLFRCLALVLSGLFWDDVMRWECFQVSLSDVKQVPGVCTVESVSPCWPLIGRLVTISASDWSLAAISHRPQLWLSPEPWAGTRDSACIKSLHYSSVATEEDFPPWFSGTKWQN